MDSHKDDTDCDGFDSYRGGGEEDTEHGDVLDTYREDTTEHGMSSHHDELDDDSFKSVPENTEPNKSIDHDETRMVNRSKIVVYLVILMSAAVAGTLTYLFVKEEEKRWYEDEFQDLSADIFDYTDVNLNKLGDAAHAIAESWTSYGTYSDAMNTNYNTVFNATLSPNVTFPHFGLEVGNLAALSRAELFFVAPLVKSKDRIEWEEYANDHQGWITEDLTIAQFTQEGSSDEEGGDEETSDEENEESDESEDDDNKDGFSIHIPQPGNIHETIYGTSNSQAKYHLPIWQTSPSPMDAYNSPVMWDLLGLDWFSKLMFRRQDGVLNTKSLALSAPVLDDLNDLIRYQESDSSDDPQWKEPKSLLVHPILDSLNPQAASVAGVVVGVIEWTDYIDEDLGEGKAKGMVLGLEYDCPGSPLETHTFLKEREELLYLGNNYVHDEKYDYIAQRHRLLGDGIDGDGDSNESDEGDDDSEESDDRRRFLDEEEESSEEPSSSSSSSSSSDDNEGSCAYYISVHMNENFVAKHEETSDAPLYTAVVCSIFILTGLVFLLYDCLVQIRNRKVVTKAERSNALVTSLFPKNVAEQLMDEPSEHTASMSSSGRNRKKISAFQSRALQALGIDDNTTSNSMADVTTVEKTLSSKKPIADLFSEATIMFADIAGFTAWSSAREPSQVFHLLETIFNNFDKIAVRRKIFKVETVGDCYVAVCGLPTPNKDHAVCMVRFAWESLLAMNNLMTKLEVELGPETSALKMRYGIHSGPVTAGVLRGQKARFQLFGDSMNKASRIETSGMAGRIHLSQETADLLISRGKGHWINKREDMVNLKGLGQVSTYWLEMKSEGSERTDGTLRSAISKNSSNDSTSRRKVFSSAQHTWHTKILSKYLQKVVAFRNRQQGDKVERGNEDALKEAETKADFSSGTQSTCISFPVISERVYGGSTELHSDVRRQIGEFVEEISEACNPNHFHNFDRDSHMLMAVVKLLSRTESSTMVNLDDPMTQFVAVLTALIHNVDNPGITNLQIAGQGHPMASMYKSSMVQRNSLDVAWKLLNQDCYHELRRSIYRNPSEFEFFRQLVVHSLLVTDTTDASIQAERQKRWGHAFGNGTDKGGLPRYDNYQDMINKQKTALLDHIMLVSDAAYTMQHWNVYIQWNRRLYNELSKAHKDGLSDQDPKGYWYEGEKKHFDNHVIPLARSWKECPVMKASGDELLQYALSNRKEWEEKGKSILEGF